MEANPVIEKTDERKQLMELWSLKNQNILIIDDFSEMRSMMRQMVTSLGAINISTARNGEEAIACMQKTRFDIVLCDYNLGDAKDGQQILEEAKHRKLINDFTLFLMITAENTSYMVMGAMEYFPDDYLNKPFTKTTLQARLRKLMDAKQACKDIYQCIDKKQYDQALAYIDNATQYHSKYRFQLLKLKGDLLLKIENYVEAEQLYEEILEERELTWALLGLGQVYYYTDRFTEAEELFEQLIELNENYMPAYDWLAKTTESLGDTKRAQDVLKQATQKSPKAILRQRHLAQVSDKLDDQETCEYAYRQAVENGRFSCYKNSSDYTGLSKAYLNQGKSDRAMTVTKKLSRDFPGDRSAKLLADILECNVYIHDGNTDQANSLIEKSMAVYEKSPELFSCDNAMMLAQSCFKCDNIDLGESLIKHVVRNNHDNSQVIAQAQELFNEAGLEKKGQDLIDSVCNEVVSLNNKGVQLAEQGQFEASIDLFIQAAKAMPENIAINLNAAQSIILNIVKNNGTSDELMRAKHYLERAETLDKENEKLCTLNQTYQNLALKLKR